MARNITRRSRRVTTRPRGEPAGWPTVVLAVDYNVCMPIIAEPLAAGSKTFRSVNRFAKAGQMPMTRERGAHAPAIVTPSRCVRQGSRDSPNSHKLTGTGFCVRRLPARPCGAALRHSRRPGRALFNPPVHHYYSPPMYGSAGSNKGRQSTGNQDSLHGDKPRATRLLSCFWACVTECAYPAKSAGYRAAANVIRVSFRRLIANLWAYSYVMAAPFHLRSPFDPLPGSVTQSVLFSNKRMWYSTSFIMSQRLSAS